MKILKIPLWIIWRIWFYTLTISLLIILFPILFILTINQKHYHLFWKVAKLWAYIIFYGMGFHIKLIKEEKIKTNKSCIICANHTSFLDLFLVIILSKNPVVFVGKKELEKIPIFGFIFKRVCISVDRSNAKSRKGVYDLAKNRIKQGISIAIFPEGLVPEENVILAPFKNGAFNLAIEHQIPILPYIFFDCKRFFSWNILKGRPGKIRVKQAKIIDTKGKKIEDRDMLKNEVFNKLYNELESDKQYITDTINVK